MGRRECNPPLPDLPVSDERIRLHRQMIEVEAMMMKVEADIAVVMESEDTFDAAREKILMAESDALSERHQRIQQKCIESYDLVAATVKASVAQVRRLIGKLELDEYERARLLVEADTARVPPVEEPAILKFPAAVKQQCDERG